MTMIATPEYIEALLRPATVKQAGRKVWSIDLETVIVPFFTATNTEHKTSLPYEALGCPLRLSYHDDGTPKFSEKSGKPVIKVAKEIAEQVKLMRENFIAGLQAHTARVRKGNPEGYSNEIRLSAEAGHPIKQADDNAIARYNAEVLAQLMALKQSPKPEPEPVTA